MKQKLLLSRAVVMTVASLSACVSSTTSENSTTTTTASETVSTSNSEPISIVKQGMFSSGGTVTEPVAGEYDETTNWLDQTRAGNTAHVDHANVLYQIPENDN